MLVWGVHRGLAYLECLTDCAQSAHTVALKSRLRTLTNRL